jgi:hypothetical protein
VFRQYNIVGGTNNQAGVEWVGNNTYNISTVNMGGSAANVGTQLDEDQVATVIAVYKMNQ